MRSLWKRLELHVTLATKKLNAEHIGHHSRSIEYKRKLLEILIVKNEFIKSERERRTLLGA